MSEPKGSGSGDGSRRSGSGDGSRRSGSGTSTSGNNASGNTWLIKVGVAFAAISVLFLMALVLFAIQGKSIPDGSRFLIYIIVAFAVAFAFAGIGGDAAAKGSIPFFEKSPMKFSVGGGIAVFFIALVVCNYLFSPNSTVAPIPDSTTDPASGPTAVQSPPTTPASASVSTSIPATAVTLSTSQPPNPGASSTTDCILTISFDFAMIRSEPDMRKPELATVKSGQYTALARTTSTFAGKEFNWFQIESEGRTGWIVDDGIQIESKTLPCDTM